MQPPLLDRPPFDRIRVWIFDLDNTLYPAALNLFAQVDRRMGEFVADRFGLPYEAARLEQKRLFRDHGTTLRGLMVERGVDPVAFMDYVHDIDLGTLDPDPRLAAALARLPGRRVIHTNGSAKHAARVCRRLGLGDDLFDDIFDIEAADWIPKPDPRPYGALAARLGFDPATACMFEDIARNLAPAAALGMTTVWVRSEADWARPDRGGAGARAHIHCEVDDLPAFLTELTGSASA
ncbi:MAG TPA: pyrimidine 5'-nucleotidase [Azospirillaceae bacterium]|nr:pyrimidine 5'-nucleotidase [Azospirillaceae bacterium]